MPRARTILNDYSIVVEKVKTNRPPRKHRLRPLFFFAIFNFDHLHLFRLDHSRCTFLDLTSQGTSHTWVYGNLILNARLKNQIGRLRQSIHYDRIRIVLFLKTIYPFDWKQSYTALLKITTIEKSDCMTACSLALQTV